MHSRLDFKYKLISNCPLKNINKGESGYYYRIIRNKTLKEEDFLPSYWLCFFKEQKMKLEKDNNSDELCKSQGISLLMDEVDAIGVAKRYKKMQAKAICKGYLDNKKGVLQKTPSDDWTSHHTLYVYKGIKELDFFKIEVIL